MGIRGLDWGGGVEVRTFGFGFGVRDLMGVWLYQ